MAGRRSPPRLPSATRRSTPASASRAAVSSGTIPRSLPDLTEWSMPHGLTPATVPACRYSEKRLPGNELENGACGIITRLAQAFSSPLPRRPLIDAAVGIAGSSVVQYRVQRGPELAKAEGISTRNQLARFHSLAPQEDLLA